jgi:hypothetical protein
MLNIDSVCRCVVFAHALLAVLPVYNYLLSDVQLYLWSCCG